ncbi:MAG: GNAT family protein, partial [Planctomycetota bacterium]
MPPAALLAQHLESAGGIALRFPVESDRDAFIDLRRSCRQYLQAWEPAAAPGFDAFGDDGFTHELATARRPDSERWLIVHHASTADRGRIVGRLCASAIERGPLQSCRFGYWVAERFAGRGFMTAALRLGVRRCFESLGLHRVEASVAPENAPSKSCLVKAGFRLEGYSPRMIKLNGAWRDQERYAITIEEYRVSAPRNANVPNDTSVSPRRPARSPAST